MGRKLVLITAKKTFQGVIESSQGLHAAVECYTIRNYEGVVENPLHPN